MCSLINWALSCGFFLLLSSIGRYVQSTVYISLYGIVLEALELFQELLLAVMCLCPCDMSAGVSYSRAHVFSISRPGTPGVRLTRRAPVRSFSETSVYFSSKDVKDGEGGKEHGDNNRCIDP